MSFRHGCWLCSLPAVLADWGVLLAAGSLPDCLEQGAVPTAAEAPVLGHAHSVHVWRVVLHRWAYIYSYLHHHSSGKPDPQYLLQIPCPPSLLPSFHSPPSSLPPSPFPMSRHITVPEMCCNPTMMRACIVCMDLPSCGSRSCMPTLQQSGPEICCFLLSCADLYFLSLLPHSLMLLPQKCCPCLMGLSLHNR